MKPKKDSLPMPKKNLPKKNRTSPASSSQPPGGSRPQSDTSVDQSRVETDQVIRGREGSQGGAASAIGELDERQKVPVHIACFSEISSSDKKCGDINNWGGDLVGRWLSENGVLKVSGWAIDERAGLPALKVFLVKEGKVLVNAGVDGDRPDVSEAHGAELLRFSGWTLEVQGSELAIGESDLEVCALLHDGTSLVRLGNKTVSVGYAGGSGKVAQTSFESIVRKRFSRIFSMHLSNKSVGWSRPIMNSEECILEGGILVMRGWAISMAGIARVKVYVNGRFVAPGFYGYPRPDVKCAYPYVPGSGLSEFRLSIDVDTSEREEPVSVIIRAVDKEGAETEILTTHSSFSRRNHEGNT